MQGTGAIPKRQLELPMRWRAIYWPASQIQDKPQKLVGSSCGTKLFVVTSLLFVVLVVVITVACVHGKLVSVAVAHSDRTHLQSPPIKSGHNRSVTCHLRIENVTRRGRIQDIEINAVSEHEEEKIKLCPTSFVKFSSFCSFVDYKFNFINFSPIPSGILILYKNLAHSLTLYHSLTLVRALLACIYKSHSFFDKRQARVCFALPVFRSRSISVSSQNWICRRKQIQGQTLEDN